MSAGASRRLYANEARSKKNAKKNRKKNRNRFGQSTPKYLMTVGAMGALLTCAPVSALAESRRPRGSPRVCWRPSTARVRLSKASVSTFHPARSKPCWLLLKLTDLQVLLPNEKLRTLPSPGVSGVYTSRRRWRRYWRAAASRIGSADPRS